ncbi:hypothetical protein JCM14036_28340 [Desulfotomaculum defluvii]
MKIYLLPVNNKLQPTSQPFMYPHHNEDYGVEQDFHRYLALHSDMIVENPDLADWHYLPVYWTRWHLNHHHGRVGLQELKEEVSKVMLNDAKTFTICQYDDGPMVNLGRTTVFLASRPSNLGVDIPLLCSSHPIPAEMPPKRYLASFVGLMSNHVIRKHMAQVLKGRNDIYLHDGDLGTQFFIHNLLESYISLCPRGYGGSSFRFFEAMQLGVVPFLIGDQDTRPFKRFIKWEQISLFTNSISDIDVLLNAFEPTTLLTMGERAKEVWQNDLTFQKWCPYVIEELKYR